MPRGRILGKERAKGPMPNGIGKKGDEIFSYGLTEENLEKEKKSGGKGAS